MTGVEKDKYSFLSGKTWLKICDILADDLKANKDGITIVAPEFPQAGQESIICFELETDGMRWVPNGNDTILSQAILRKNSYCHDEVRRCRESLVNTIAVLDAWLLAGTPDNG